MTGVLSYVRRLLQRGVESGPGSDVIDVANTQRDEALAHGKRLEELLNTAIEQRNQAHQERDVAKNELLVARAKTAEDRRLVRSVFNELRSDREQGAAERATALILLTAASQINQVALLLENTGFLKAYRPVVVSYIDPQFEQLRALREKLGLTVLTNEHVYGQEVRGGYRSTAPLNDNNRYNFWTSLALDDAVDWTKIAGEIRYQTELRNAFLRTLSSVAASLLILFEDNAETDSGIWIDAANVLGIPSAIIPFTIADSVEPAESHRPDPLFHVSSNKYNELAAQRFPEWTITHRGIDLIRRPGISILAAEWLGLAPPDPWILNSSHANAVAVESEAMMQHYQRLGVSPDRLRKTGSLSDDILHANRARGDGRPTILCAFPPNQLSVRPGLEFTEYRALVGFWLGALKQTGWHVIVRPHPALPAVDLEILRSHGVEMSTSHTAALIPQCDLFVACVSSTIRWALAMGKPVLNYDVFRYAYRDFDDVPAVLTVDTKVSFADALERLTSGGLDQLTAAAQRDANRWGEIDGRSGERILQLLDSLRASAAE
jgi:hypothetical protein